MENYVCFTTRVPKESSAYDEVMETVCHELGKTEWGAKCVAAFNAKKNKIKAKVSTDAAGKFAAVDFVCPNDFLMIRLGKEFGFPRGLCCVLDLGQEVVYPATFYPKFANDCRNSADLFTEFVGVAKFALTVKVSGSTGKVALFGDKNWSLSSKNNSLSSEELPYVLWNYEIMKHYMTESALATLAEEGVRSMGVEFFYTQDQTHGYGYKQSGFVVTCVVNGYDTTGRPVYCSPQELVRISRKVGFPVDDPVVLTNAEDVARTFTTIKEKRNLLLLTDLKEMFPTHRFDHNLFVDGENTEGFVVRRYKADGTELPLLKYKCWPYQLVTQVLRRGLTGYRTLTADAPLQSLVTAGGELTHTFLDLLDTELDKWVVTDNLFEKRFCKMVVVNAAKQCFRPYESQPTTQGYWVELGKLAVQEIKNLGGRKFEELESVLPLLSKSKQTNTGKTCVLMVGLPGLGKSTQAKALTKVLSNAAYFTQDDFPSKVKFFQAVKKSSAQTVVVDRGNHTKKHRSEVRDLVKWGQFVVIDFVGKSGKSGQLLELAHARVEGRGYNHQSLYPTKNLSYVLDTFAKQYEEVTDDEKNSSTYVSVDPRQTETQVFDHLKKNLKDQLNFYAQTPKDLFAKQVVQPKLAPLLLKLEVTDNQALVKYLGDDCDLKDEYHVTLFFNRGSKKDGIARLHTLMEACKGRQLSVVPKRVVRDENAVALEVELPSMVASQNAHPHVTLQTMNGTPPVYSNTLLAKSSDEVQVLELKNATPLQVKFAVQWK